MKHRSILALLSTLLATGLVVVPAVLAEPPASSPEPPSASPEPADEVSEVTAKATKLEAELGKYKDTSPEAADVLVQLVDLYHGDGRVFGLIRAAERFVAAHPSEKRHQAVMLKLIDALTAVSRYDELRSACRQYLARYPKTRECEVVERRLADSLVAQERWKEAGDACRAVWARHRKDDVGRRYALDALDAYGRSQQTYTQAAELAEAMMDDAPKGPFATLLGLHAMYRRRSLSDYTGATVVGQKLLKKGLPDDPELVYRVHWYQASNYDQQRQYRNTADHRIAAYKAQPSEPVLYHTIEALQDAQAEVGEIKPLVDDYMKHYARGDSRERAIQAWLVEAHLRAEDKEPGLKLAAEFLKQYGDHGTLARGYVGHNGREPAQAAESEKVLLAGIEAHPDNCSLMQYALSIDVYRDRMKQPEKARAVIRQMIEHPRQDHYARIMVEWLWGSEPDEGQFREDVAAYLASRSRYPFHTTFGGFLAGWAEKALESSDEKIQARGKHAQEALKKSADDPVFVMLDAVGSANDDVAKVQARQKLIESEQFDKLCLYAKKRLIDAQRHYFYYEAPSDERYRAAEYAKMRVELQKDSFSVAQHFVQVAAERGKNELRREAVEHLLQFDPPGSVGGSGYYAILCASAVKDKGLTKKAYQWLVDAEAKYGPNGASAQYVGRYLDTIGLNEEAIAYWTKYASHDPDSHTAWECASDLYRRMEPEKRSEYAQGRFALASDYQGHYAGWVVSNHLGADDVDAAVKVLGESLERHRQRPFQSRGWDQAAFHSIIWSVYSDQEMPPEDKRRVLEAITRLERSEPAGEATVALSCLTPVDAGEPIERLITLQSSSQRIYGSWSWDNFMRYAQDMLREERFLDAATLLTSMLADVQGAGSDNREAARKLVTQCYSRLGSVGLTIDEDSPIAPLLRAALSLRLGDEELAFETYLAHRQLFAEHRLEVPVDLLHFVCERLIAAGGEENLLAAEDTLRAWLIKHSESKQIKDSVKARTQLLLARTFFAAQRFEVARSEFNTLLNRYPETPEALEAEFGIGETYMAQKVYDEAERVFEDLAGRQEIDVVVRAEFLRGVLAMRRGDKDEARDIFRDVLDRVPSLELANQALFSLSEVYGAEQRYLDQLKLLQTVGRLGRESKRFHAPGMPLSIVVHDSDLGISRGHNRVPVEVFTEPGGDRETVGLTSAGAGKGLFRIDLDTELGTATPGDGKLQLTGKDVIRCDYPTDFKAEFRTVPISDVEIRIASDARFQVASTQLDEEEAESFSDRLQREARRPPWASSSRQEPEDERRSQGRPPNEIKPGNPIYVEVEDPDRDMSDEPDKVVVKLEATSGDQVQVPLKETGAHTGVFVGAVPTGDLPASATASDTAIGHSPLMAIDNDPETMWLSEPDAITPKHLTVDLKDVYDTSGVTMTTPNAEKNAPVRAELQGSYDGKLWFHLIGHPEREQIAPLTDKSGPMTRYVFNQDGSAIEDWPGLVEFFRGVKPNETTPVAATPPEQEAMSDVFRVQSTPADEDAEQPVLVVWDGKLVQPRDGAMRFQVHGRRCAIVVDGRRELTLDEKDDRTADVWLGRGVHRLTVVAMTPRRAEGVWLRFARPNMQTGEIDLDWPKPGDFDPGRAGAGNLDQPAATAQADGSAVVGNSSRAAAKTSGTAVTLGLDTVKTEGTSDGFGVKEALADRPQRIGNWRLPEDVASWQVDLQPGVYAVVLDAATEVERPTIAVELDDRQFEGKLQSTGSYATFEKQALLTLSVEEAGTKTLKIHPTEPVDAGVMNLSGIEFRPVDGSRVLLREGNRWRMRFPSRELRYVRFLIHEYRGEAVAINHIEIGGPQADGSAVARIIPTDADLLAMAANQSLEMAGGDEVTASYTDERRQAGGGDTRLLTAKLQATYFNALVLPTSYQFRRGHSGEVMTITKSLRRIEPGERIIVRVRDYDEDRTDQPDTIPIEVTVNGDEPLRLQATETEEFSGVFTKEVDTSDTERPGRLTVKPGDRIVCRYVDRENTFPGHSVPREDVVEVIEPTEARIRILPTRTRTASDGSRQWYIDQSAGPLAGEADNDQGNPESPTVGVALGAPLTVEVIDTDAAKDSLSHVDVTLRTSDGVEMDIRCVVPPSRTSYFHHHHMARHHVPGKIGRDALIAGRFVGQTILQLGGRDSPEQMPLTADMPRNLIGGPPLEEESKLQFGDGLVARVLNLTGKDLITATYKDTRRPDGKSVEHLARARLVADGVMLCTDRDVGSRSPRVVGSRSPRVVGFRSPRVHEQPIEQLHVGERMFLGVVDPDRDTTDARDHVEITVTTTTGEREVIRLEETLAHSGEFTGSVALEPNEKPTAESIGEGPLAVECYFGDVITLRYVDPAPASQPEPLEQVLEVPVVVGTDGVVSAFTKVFQDEDLAVETRFHVAESYFELFKSHNQLEREEEAQADLEAGRRVLREVIEDYTDPKYVPRVAYLLGQFAQEMKNWSEATRSYELILRQYPDHSLAADAQYKLAQTYEEAGEFDKALEAYVTLAATYPGSPLIANVMIRICDHFYKSERYEVAAQVGEKFLEQCEGHQHAPRMAFRIGQSYYKAEQPKRAADAFDRFVKLFPDATLAADALFWAGECYRKSRDNQTAFQRYNRCRWDFPASEAAKYARGRLAMPEMLKQFDAAGTQVN